MAFRALQGLGASMLNPVALSIVANVFKDPRERARATGVWGAVGGVSFAVGPLLGGALTQAIGWRRFPGQRSAGGAGGGAGCHLRAGVEGATGTAVRPGGAVAGLYVPDDADVCGDRRDARGLVVWANCGDARGLGGVAGGFLLYEPRRHEPLVDLRFFRSVPSVAHYYLAVYVCFSRRFSISECAVSSTGPRILGFSHRPVYAAVSHHDDAVFSLSPGGWSPTMGLGHPC